MEISMNGQSSNQTRYGISTIKKHTSVHVVQKICSQQLQLINFLMTTKLPL